jgi:hypothetical protein
LGEEVEWSNLGTARAEWAVVSGVNGVRDTARPVMEVEVEVEGE